MSWPEYRRVDHAAPYILDLCAGGGRPPYFGAQHTYDPADLQVKLIERLWQDVSPTIAFNEGGNPPTLKTADEAVRNHGEPGLVRHLAAKAGIKVTSLDPPRSKVAQHLRAKFSAEEVKLYFVLGAVLTHRKNPVEPFEERMARVFSIFAQTVGLEAAPSNLEELEATYRRYFPAAGSALEMPAEWFDPQKSDSFLNEMSRQASDFRDRFMIDVLVSRVRPGERVFAVVGASHVVMQEPAIRKMLSRLPRQCVP